MTEAAEVVECAGCAEHIASRGSAVITRPVGGEFRRDVFAVLTRQEVFWAVDLDPGQDVIAYRLFSGPWAADDVVHIPEGGKIPRCHVHELAARMLGEPL
jgi:hypothetical protein